MLSKMRMSIRLLPVLLAAVLVSACGGTAEHASKPGDARAIRRVLATGMTHTGPETVCERTFSRGFIRRVFGTAARCHRSVRHSAGDTRPPQRVGVARIEVRGDEASAL